MIPNRETRQCPRCNVPAMPSGRCPICSVDLEWRGGKIRVRGSNVDEVGDVLRQLTDHVSEQESARRRRSPWRSGAFYLTAVVVLVSLLLVAGRALPVWALPIVIIGVVLLVAVLGGLQLRQDERLSERGFLALMKMSLARLPLLLRARERP